MTSEQELIELLQKRKEILFDCFDEAVDNDTMSPSFFVDNAKPELVSNAEKIRENLMLGITPQKERIMVDNADAFFLCGDEFSDDDKSIRALLLKWGDCLDFSTDEATKKSAIIASKCIDKFLPKTVEYAEKHGIHSNYGISEGIDALNVVDFLNGIFEIIDTEDKKYIFAQHLLHHCTSLMITLADNIGGYDFCKTKSFEELNKSSMRDYGEPLVLFLQKRVGANRLNDDGVDEFVSFKSLSLDAHIASSVGFKFWRKALKDYADLEDIEGGLAKAFISKQQVRSVKQKELFINELILLGGTSSSLTGALFDVDMFNEEVSKSDAKTINKLYKDENLIQKHIQRLKNGNIENLYGVGGYSPVLSCFEPVFEETTGALLFKKLPKEFLSCKKSLFANETLKKWGIDNVSLKLYGLPTIEEYFLSHPIPRGDEARSVLKELVGNEVFAKLENGKLNEKQSLSLLDGLLKSDKNYFHSMLSKKFRRGSLPLESSFKTWIDNHKLTKHSANVAIRMFANDTTMSGKLLELDLSSEKVIKELKKHFVSEDNGPSALNRFWYSFLETTPLLKSEGKHRLEFDTEMLSKVILPCTYKNVKGNTLLQTLFELKAEECKNKEDVKKRVNETFLDGIKRLVGQDIAQFEYMMAQNRVYNSDLGQKMKRLLPM